MSSGPSPLPSSSSGPSATDRAWSFNLSNLHKRNPPPFLYAPTDHILTFHNHPNIGAATLRAQMQADARREAKQKQELEMQKAIAASVVRSVKQVEETVEQQIRQLELVENMGSDDLELLRERRMATLKKQKERNEQLKMLGHGAVQYVVDEKDFFARAKASNKMVVHFARSTTRRCEILLAHLQTLAVKHIETLFIQVDAEKVPFLAERLKIHTLPSLVLCKSGKTEHTMIGFDELGGVDDFTTVALEGVLFRHGVLDFAAEQDETSRFGKGPSKSVQASKNVDFGDWQD